MDLSRFKQFFSAGHTIFEQGDLPKHLYFVATGVVEIFIQVKTARKIVATIEKGGIFGEMAVVDDKPRSATANAKTDVTCFALDASQLDTIIQTHPNFSLKLIRLLSKKLRDSNEHISELIQQDRKRQIMVAIAHYARTYGKSGYKGKRIPTQGFVDTANSRLGLEKQAIEKSIEELVLEKYLDWGADGRKTLILNEKFQKFIGQA